MCGICGVYNGAGDSSEEGSQDTLAAMSALMQRRGPDDAGSWQDNRCAFGFRRLSILDLAPTGHQPMLTTDGRYALVFNGEIYNFREIRADLEARGVRFRSSGDTEVALYALAEYGASALSRFNGMFALAFYDTVTRKLLLARDHAGIKPLYYLHTAQGLVFASQYNQLLAHPWAKRLPISSDALALYLRFGYIPAPYAMLEQTHMLDAGCWASIDAAGRLEQGRFYEFPKFPKADLKGNDAVDAFDAALGQSVARHLISDVPVGVFLSGGIDSSLVAAEASRQTNHALKAFTIGVAGNAAMDETDSARRFAQELELEHLVRVIEPRDALDLLDDALTAYSEPMADFSIFPTLLVSRLAREHVKVALSGDGGDELFWGYPDRFGSVLDQAAYFGRPQQLRYAALFAKRYLKQGKATRDILWPTIGRLYQKKHTLLNEQDLDAAFPTLPKLPQNFDLFDYGGKDPDETAAWLRWNEFRLHLAFVLLKVDRASMHNSLEVRVPLLDKQVIEVALRTDWRSCLDLKERVGKIPLRRALQKRVSFQNKAKKGFTVPMSEWLAGPLQPLLREKVLGRRDFFGLEINPAPLLKLNDGILAGNSAGARGLWQLLSLALWIDHHYAASSSAQPAQAYAA